MSLIPFLDGKVDGGDCNPYGNCYASLGLECYHPDGELSGKSKCQSAPFIPAGKSYLL